MANDIRRDINRGLSWVGMASTAVTLLDAAAIFVILRYWISAEEYGVATKAWWMFPILDLATDLGLAAALIQRDDHTPRKVATVFWLGLLMSFALVGLVYAAEPALTGFYENPQVWELLVVYSLKLIWQNTYAIPQALMRKQLRYRELSIVRVLANMAEFSAKVGFAAAGYGVWCFVWAPMLRSFVSGIGIQICNPWRPQFSFNLREAWSYAVFGAKASGSQILFYFYTNVDYAIVGRFFGEGMLGIYRLAYEVVLEPARIIAEVIREVAFSAFSRLKASREQVVDQFIAFTRLNLVLTMTYMVIVFVTADDLLYALFEERYLPGAPAIRWLAVVGVLRAVSFVIPPLLDGLGYPGRTLRYQVVAATVLPTLFYVCAEMLGEDMNFVSVAVAWAIGYPVAFAVLAALALAALDLRLSEYVRRTIGIPLCAAAALVAGLGFEWVASGLSPGIRFLAAIAIMMPVSFGLLALTQGITPRTIAKAIRG